MKRIKQLTLTMAAAAAALTLVSASAFAEERPNDGTRGRSNRDDSEWRDRRGDASVQQRGDDSRYRNNNNNNNSQRHYAQGRITRVEPHGGDYRVWVGGSRYPFHVPGSHYRSNRNRWNIGLEIRIGGIYNSGGYYDYYEDNYRGGRRDDYRNGYLRGVVQDVDHRRGVLLVRDEYSGDRVRVEMRGRDRTFDRIRRGDFIEVEGDWRRGTFEAFRADLLDSRRDRRW